jgi:hypothetical protein
METFAGVKRNELTEKDMKTGVLLTLRYQKYAVSLNALDRFVVE